MQPGVPYLQQLHLAEAGPLQTQPCAHLAHPAGQQEQQPVGEIKIKLRTFSGSLRLEFGGGGLTVLETSHVFMSFPFSSIPILGSIFQGVYAAMAGTGEAGGECGTPKGSPGFHQALSLQTLLAHSSAVGDSIRGTQKKSQCWFPPQHPLVLSLRAY